ncbi:MAG: M1 family aminopeptidase [Terriglobia bacterium]
MARVYKTRGRRVDDCRLLIFLALAQFFSLANARGQTSAPRFEVTNYAIDAELFSSTHLLTAKARVDFIPQADLSTLSFELHSSLKVKSVVDAAGKNLNYRQDGLNFQVDFLNPLPSGKTSSITVEYGGTLATADGSPVENLKLAYVGPEGSYLLYPARWFPVNRYGTNRFAATMRITVPSDETVIASGKNSAPERAAGKVTYTYQFDQKSFPGTVLAGKYVVQPSTAVGADMTIYLKAGHEQYAASYGETAAKILEFYSHEFGPLPNQHLALVEIDDNTVGGYSAPGLVALASRGFSTPVNYRLLAHEISHQWWRCLVSPASPDDAFLDEGLATYSAAMDVQEMAGETAFEDVMHEIEVGALTHEEVAPISEASRLHEFTPEYESIIFQKGAMVFHMLRWVIGDEAFFKTLQAMTHQYAGGSISTDQFQKLAEQAGKQDLTYFFAQWVSSTGVPQFKRSWAIYRTPSGYQVVGKIQQDLDIFRMPVEVRVLSEGGKPVNERVDMVGTTADFTINTRAKPLRVLIDPASRLLKFDDKTKTAVEMAKGDQLVAEQAYLEAIKQYQAVLDLNKNSSLAQYRIGEIFFKLRNYNAAMESFRQALAGDLDPKWVEVWSYLNIGKLFDVTGQRDRALNEYQRALQTNNNTQGALDEANKYIQKPYVQEVRPAS